MAVERDMGFLLDMVLTTHQRGHRGHRGKEGFGNYVIEWVWWL
jgi:hypothetical protein